MKLSFPITVSNLTPAKPQASTRVVVMHTYPFHLIEKNVVCVCVCVCVGGAECFPFIYEPSRIDTLITKVLFPGFDTFNFVVARFLSFLGKVVATLFGFPNLKSNPSFYSILPKNRIPIFLRAEGKMCKHETYLFIHFHFPL